MAAEVMSQLVAETAEKALNETIAWAAQNDAPPQRWARGPIAGNLTLLREVTVIAIDIQRRGALDLSQPAHRTLARVASAWTDDLIFNVSLIPTMSLALMQWLEVATMRCLARHRVGANRQRRGSNDRTL